MTATLHRGVALHVLATIADESVAAVVTDPPYGLSREPDITEVLTHWLAGDDYDHGGGGFMGKSWDSFVPGPSVWKECLRVLKPGGHLLCFAGSRTVDLMGVSIRLGGFEIRDQIQWIHSQGFPKSHNVEKAGAGPDWAGWGTALKPAQEPILVARKPAAGTITENVLAHGTGALNIDAARVGEGGRWPANVIFGHHDGCELVGTAPDTFGGGAAMSKTGKATVEFGGGYEPGDGFAATTAEVPVFDCHDDCAVALLDRQAGPRKSGSRRAGTHRIYNGERTYGDQFTGDLPAIAASTGGASRFFYTAKAPKTERDAGLPAGMKNDHPTVKPLALMAYLVKLVTPPGGIVLDPFCGSGTTLVAAESLGFDSIGIDRDDENIYLTIARHRVAAAAHPSELPFGGPLERT